MRRKRVCILSILTAAAIMMVGCGNSKNEKITTEYMEKVEALDQNGLPSVQDVKSLDEEYYNLTPKQKELVTNYGTVKKYLDMDLDNIKSIQERVDQILAEDKVSYKDVVEIEEKYNQMPSNEQTYITGIDQLEKYKELDEYEKVAIVATRFLKQSLKNGSSMEVEEINVKKEGNYYVKINYSATNGFGGRKDAVACLDVTSKYMPGLIGLTSLTGGFEEGSNTLLGGYLGFGAKEVSVDPDKILANIDVKFDENGNY